MMGNSSEAHICQCLSRLSTVRRNSTVTIMVSRRKTGMQFVEGVLDLSYGLIQLGIRPGHVIALSALNSDLYLEWLLAVTYAGGIAAPLNYRWSKEEAKSAMEVAKPILLVTDLNRDYWHSNFDIGSVLSLKWHVLMESPTVMNSTGTVITTELLKRSFKRSVTVDYLWGPQSTAIICFTSGTTGRPKGAAIGHSALVFQSLAKIAMIGYNEDDVYLHTAPLCHIGGISSAIAMLMAGGCHAIMSKFEAKLALEAIEEHNVTSIITVPAIMSDFISFHRSKETYRQLESMKKILNGGGSLSPELIKDATTIFPRAKLVSAYGMTEACSSLTFMTLYDPTKESQAVQSFDIENSTLSGAVGVCVGKPAPHVELRINGKDSSGAGKILTRGPHVMLRYWGQASQGPFDPLHDGWLETGDIGKMDDCGNLWLIGRHKGRIKSGGENIYPEEVEAILSKHPGVSAVIVVGVPHSRLTEIVVACVQIKDDWKWADSSFNLSAQYKSLSSEILRIFCREKNLTGFKVPKKFILWSNPFPKTTTGKLRRDLIWTEALSHVQSFSSKL